MWRMDVSPWSASNLFLEMQRNSLKVLPVMIKFTLEIQESYIEVSKV